MKQFSYLTVVLGLLLIVGCRDFGLEAEEANPSGPRTIEVGEDAPFQLGLGDTATLDVADVEIEFSLLGADNRCPTGVECIHPGQATIILTTRDFQNVRTQVALSIPGLTDYPVDQYAVTFNGLRYQLLALSPYPRPNSATSPETVRALIRVERVS